MSDDPETARQIAELAKDDRPLLVLDVDEVVLEFVGPLVRFVESHGYAFRTVSFRLTGNVVDKSTGEPVDEKGVWGLLDEFFETQHRWQTPASGAEEVIASFAGKAEIVMLTAMPHRYRKIRRAMLDHLSFPYPLLTTEAPKGPAIKALRGVTPRPVAFVDDIPHNHESVRQAVPDAGLLHLMAHGGMREVMPPLPDYITPATDWNDARPKISRMLGLQP